MPRDYNFADDILKRNLDAGRADKIAFIDDRGSYTYGDLAGRVARFANVLRSLGMRREERALICLTDTIDWPTAFLGAIKAGVVAVPVNTLMTEADYRFMLKDSRARLLIVSESLYSKFADALGEAADLEHVIVSRGDAHAHLSFDQLLAGAKSEAATAATTCDDICFWLYTSGSTGRPKGAVHTHADLKLTDDLYAGPILGITENDVCYSVAKLFFAYGLGNALTFPMSAGATTVLLPQRPTPDLVADTSEAAPGHRVLCGADLLCGVSRQSRGAGARANCKLRRCVSAGEALPPDIGRRWSERYGTDILDGLGSTEMLHIFLRTGPATSNTAPPASRCRATISAWSTTTASRSRNAATWANCRCAGRPAPSCIGIIASSRARPFWANGRGRATNMSRTTDGYFVYCGRRDDMLKVSGMYVSPFEVEGVLQSHPDVLEAAVVGWPDIDRLIKPKAFVVLKAPEKASDAFAEMLQDECRHKLAVYKYPRWIEFRSELPKTATGKIQRFKLRAEAEAK